MPHPRNSPSIADLWLRACTEIMRYAALFTLCCGGLQITAIITTPVLVTSNAILGAGP